MNLPATIQGLQNLAAGDSLGKVAKILPQVTVVGLVAVVAWQLARFTWLLLPHPPEVALSAPMGVTPTSRVRSTNAQQIADSHLFGVANAPDDPNNVANAPQTQIPLFLTGTIAAGDPTKGFAFIGESPATTKFVRVGDTVGGSARLHSVYQEKVMLDRGGRLESLLLPRQGAAMLGSRSTANMPANPPPARFAENIKRIAETNPAAFTEIVRPQPRIVQGVMQGFMVYPGRNRQQFAKLGLQPGDLVKAINGTPLDDQQRSAEIFNSLGSSDRAQITIERNGKIEQLTLNTSQITLPDGTDPQQQGTPPQETRTYDANGAPVQ
jgi:general secretion pathway protein C